MFRSGNKVRIKDSVLRKVRISSEILGCTVEEFIERAVEKEAEKTIALMSRRDSQHSELEAADAQPESL